MLDLPQRSPKYHPNYFLVLLWFLSSEIPTAEETFSDGVLSTNSLNSNTLVLCRQMPRSPPPRTLAERTFSSQ